MNIPNILTLSRIALLPVLITALYFESFVWIAFGIYALCAITDFLDGYLARKMNSISAFGTFLDPIADKIFVAALLITLTDIGRLDGIWTIPAILILMREFLISGLREFLGPKDIKVPVSQLAKYKTAIQMIALAFLIIGPALPYCLEIGHISLSIAAILTLITGWGYFKAGLPHIRS